MKNQDIANLLYNIGDILEIKGVDWKPIAYRKAAFSIESLSEDIEQIYKKGGQKALEEIPGVGKAIAEKIIEFLKTGRIAEYDKLKKGLPLKIDELMRIEGLGPKRIMLLYKKLKVKNLRELEAAAKAGKISKIPSLGEKTEENLLKSIAFAKLSGKRKILGYALPVADEIVSNLKKLKEVAQIQVCGSIARKKETVGDIDILVTTNSPAKVVDYFSKMKDVKRVLAKGATKSSIIYKEIECDLRVVEPKSFGSAVQYFVGSKEHNVALRKIAISKGFKLSEYGLFKGESKIAGANEEEIYKKLGLKWIPFELRENRGEIQAAQKNKLPKLIQLKDIKCDLQMHSNYSDGANTVEQMALQCKKLGLKYMAVTDHIGQLAIAGAMNPKQVLKQRKEIDKLNSKLKDFTVLQGAEVDIKLDGSLAADNKVLKHLDFVVGSIHTGLRRTKDEQTKRIIKAVESGFVNVIGHPTGRLINAREGYELDWEKVFESAKKNNVALEINAYPTRMDLTDSIARSAKDAGVMLSIGTDSHSVEQLKNIELGVFIARRAWCEHKNIINTFSLKEFQGWVKK